MVGRESLKKRRHEDFYSARAPFKIIEGVDTEPFVRLSPWAVWVLARFYIKWDGRTRNRGNLSVTYKEVGQTISSATFIRALWELVGFGFLDVARFGRLERNASLYALSDRWRGLSDPVKCGEIECTLEEIRKLQRERGSTSKRSQLAVLRHRLLGRRDV